MMGHRVVVAAGVAAIAVASLIPVGAVPQAQAQPPSFKGTTRTVAVYATVTNGQGRLVPNLTREDFAVDDDGKRQDLTVFANDLQPITVVMLLDRSGSMKPNLDLEEKAAEAFVRSMAVEDKARIGSFSKYVQIDPLDFTSDHDVMFNILRNELQSDGPTPLWNAVDRGIDKLLIEQGRRVILVFTDGVDEPLNFSGKNKSLKDVMKRAEEQDVMVYAIGLAGQNGMPRTGLATRSADGEARRWIAEDRGGHWRRLLRADVGEGSGRHLHARGRRTASSVRAGIHTGKA